MSDLQSKALARATAILDALKVRYAIEVQPGEYVGELKVAPPVTKSAPKRDFRDFHYVELVASAKPGDVLEFEVPDPDADSFRGSLSAAGCRLRGLGSLLTSITRNGDTARVEALVVK